MSRRNKTKQRASQAVAVPDASRLTPGVSLSDPGALAAFAPPSVGGHANVTEMTALNLSGVWSAVRVISGAVSTIPLHVYRREDVGRREDAGGAGARLARNPCPEIGRATFWETLTAHVLTWGNGYAEIEEDGAGRPLALWPLLPHQTRPFRDGKELKYETFGAGFRTVLPARSVLHVRGMGFDGLRGYSVIQMARRSLGLATAAEQAGEGFFANGMRPGGWVEFPGSLQDLQKLNAEENLRAKHGGAARFGKALLMYGGMKYHELSIDPRDAQFLETREFQTQEIARWFDLPPHKIRDLKRATFSNIEAQGIDFVSSTLMYWLGKIAEEYDRKILSREGPDLYAEHVADALLRGDTISRFTAYGLGRQWGIFSPNDCRRKENLPPIPGGDVYHYPVNMAPLGSEPKPPGGAVADPKEPPPENLAVARAVALDIAREVADADAADLERAAEGDAKDRLEWLCRKTVKHGGWSWVAEVVENRCRSLSGLLGRAVRPEDVALRVDDQRRADSEGLALTPGRFAALADRWRHGVPELAAVILEAAGVPRG